MTVHVPKGVLLQPLEGARGSDMHPGANKHGKQVQEQRAKEHIWHLPTSQEGNTQYQLTHRPQP